MQPKKSTIIITLTALLFIGLSLIPNLQAAEFSADMEISSRGEIIGRGKIFIKGDISRHEMGQDGHKVTVINRSDKGVVWTLIPQNRSYLEAAIGYEDDEMIPENWSKDLEKEATRLGSETVNGIKCNKYELTDDEGGKITYWISKKDNIPVRIVTPDSEVNYRNIRFSHQPDQLFQIPAGYRKFALPKMPGMPGMGNMQGGPGGGGMPPFPSPR